MLNYYRMLVSLMSMICLMIMLYVFPLFLMFHDYGRLVSIMIFIHLVHYVFC